MTTAMNRRLGKLEQAAEDERPKEPVHIELVALDGEPPVREPWVPGTPITRIELVSLKPTGAKPCGT
jgi:hypothetical protein